MFHVPEKARLTDPNSVVRSSSVDGNNGAFTLPSPEPGWHLGIIASDGEGWEHVSVQAFRPRTLKSSRIPTWKEMCFVKDTFWDPEDEVVQYHPKKSEYINCHPHVLHLWRPADHDIPSPPWILVGLKTKVPCPE